MDPDEATGLENVADVSISDDGNHIWACTDDNTVYYRPGIEAEWEEQRIDSQFNDTKALLRHYHTTGKAEGRDVYCTM